MAEQSATVNEPPIASTEPNSERVSVVPEPWKTAPSITKKPAIRAALENLIIREPTAVPKMFAASFAPNDQPRKSPLEIKISVNISTQLFLLPLSITDLPPSLQYQISSLYVV